MPGVPAGHLCPRARVAGNRRRTAEPRHWRPTAGTPRRKRVGQVSGQTASPTSSPWMASTTERGGGGSLAWITTLKEQKKKKIETCQLISPSVSSPWLWRYTHREGSRGGSDIYTSHKMETWGFYIFLFKKKPNIFLHTDKGDEQKKPRRLI